MTSTRSADAITAPEARPTATILPFRRTSSPPSLSMTGDLPPCAEQPPILTRAWADQHIPLIEAALVLLHADDIEFERRCQRIRADDGAGKLELLSSQLERLGTHIADVADALGLTAERIRTTTAAAT